MAALGINGRPFLTLDGVVDVAALKRLHDDCIWGIVHAEWQYGVYGPGLWEKDYEDIIKYHLHWKGLPAHSVIARELKPRYEKTPLSLMRRFYKLHYGGFSAFHTVPIRQATSYDARMQPASSSDHKNRELFGPFMSWLDDQSVFEDVGRTSVFVTEQGCRTLVHSDYEYPAKPHNNEFIWVRPHTDKDLYILDRGDGTKYHMDGHVHFFNNADLHGGDAPKKMTYAIRVDGRFRPEFRERIGLPADPVFAGDVE